MISFGQYSAGFKIAFDAELVDFCTRDQEFCIYEGPKPLLTPGGHPFSHPSEDFVRLMLTDLLLFNGSSLQELSLPVLFAFQKDHLPAGRDPFMEQWANQLAADPFVRIKTSGIPALQPFCADDLLFTFAYITLGGLMERVNSFAGRVMSEISMEETEAHPFPELLRLSYLRLSSEQKVAVQSLSGAHGSGIVMPLLLVAGEISAADYIKGLLSLKIAPKEEFTEKLAEATRVKTYLGILTYQNAPERNSSDLIKAGEGDSIEFKSTLRWDIRAAKTNPAIERSCLKTIAAFLNTKGGSLLIGVRDDGSFEGIETDKFANDDKFLLHLWTLIRTCLGRDFSPYIRSRLEKTDDKTICVVECQPANRPVFLRQSGYPEEMYIRVGPSSNALDISEALKYISDHFAAG